MNIATGEYIDPDLYSEGLGEAAANMLLKHNANIDARDALGRTALFISAQHGHSASTEWLLGHGADVNGQCSEGRTPLHYAANVDAITKNEYDRHAGIIKELVKRGANPNARDLHGCTPAFVAAANFGGDMLLPLGNNGADLLAKDHRGRTPLLAAAMDNHDAWYAPSACLAARIGDLEALKWMNDNPCGCLDAFDQHHAPEVGASAKAISEEAAVGEIKLQINTESGYSVRAGCPTNLNCQTSSHELECLAEMMCEAASCGHIATMEWLIAQGADASSKNAKGNLPLYVAATNGHTMACKWLRELGAHNI